MTHDEYQKFKDEIFAEADNRYITINVCNTKQEMVNSRFANDDKRIDIIAHDFSIIKKLMWAMTSATIGSLVAAVFEIISK